MNQTNNISLCGTVLQGGRFSHQSHDKSIFIFRLGVERLSGQLDTLNVYITGAQLEQTPIALGDRVRVSGQVRSFNNKSGVGSYLVIYVFCKELSKTDDPDENLVTLAGTVCKPPVFRQTPLGREICDLLLVVNRAGYSRCDYLPCIIWGLDAHAAAGLCVSDKIQVTGRLQSRGYTKVLDGRQIEKTAFEISAAGFVTAEI